jgi:hypothetical protein
MSRSRGISFFILNIYFKTASNVICNNKKIR